MCDIATQCDALEQSISILSFRGGLCLRPSHCVATSHCVANINKKKKNIDKNKVIQFISFQFIVYNSFQFYIL